MAPINDSTKREILKSMLPDDIKNYLYTQTMLRDDLTYDHIKGCVNNLAQKVAKAPVPMDISPFAAEPPTDDVPYGPTRSAWDPQEPVDSFGRAPAGGAKPGKGSGKGEKGKGSKGDGKGKETRDCHTCGKKGHIARDC